MSKGDKSVSTARLARGVQTLCFVVLLLLICGVLARVYALVARESRAAGDLNNAVQLCRTAEEAFRGTDSLDEAVLALGGEAGERTLAFDDTLRCVSDGRYLLTMEETQADGMTECTITVSVDGETLYALTPEVIS